MAPVWQHELAAAYQAVKPGNLTVAMIIAQHSNVIVLRRQHMAAEFARVSVSISASGHSIPLGIKSEDIAQAIKLNIASFQGAS